MRVSVSLAATVFTALASSAPASKEPQNKTAAAEQCHGINGPVLENNFPDPSLFYTNDTWYSFGTFNGQDLQVAQSNNLESGWSKIRPDHRILAINESTWAGKRVNSTYGIWAPDVFQRSDNKYVMYFSAYEKAPENKTKPHCIGAALSESITGPYHPINTFKQCNETGVIDPSWFKDPSTNKQYIVYKTDRPKVYLELREVASKGANESVQFAGHAHKLLKMHEQGFSDGYNLEAPSLFKRGDIYFLAYSTHYYGDGSYNVEYATAKSVLGPYKRVKTPLLETTDEFGCSLVGPGSASFLRSPCGDEEKAKVIFHGLKEPIKPMRRQLYTASVKVNGTKLYIEKS
ncbi:unnamed protein product [Periconia digitata]|uniref:Glycoside hydrolase family 43 protein n=1 Tax=Periconia digitata TaxID=1303443 RepID=A0A9W4XPD0_9PLEO|nr:unnamed protein product [Periconia digitata]